MEIAPFVRFSLRNENELGRGLVTWTGDIYIMPRTSYRPSNSEILLSQEVG